MTILGSTNNSNWTYKLEVLETGTSVANRTSTIQVKTYIGRASSRSYLGGTYSNSVSITGASSQTQSGTITYPTYINGGEWLELKTFTFTVPNNSEPTVVTISSTLSSNDFTPSYAGASGTMQLTILHLPPEIATATMVEFNSKLINLNVPDTTVVTNLSQKRITINATAHDSATMQYRLENYNTTYNLPLVGDYQNDNIFNADYKRNPVFIDNNGKAKIIQKVKDSLGGLSSSWLYVDINGTIQEPNAILYTEPTIERTSTNIKRKSGVYSATLQRVANLTDNIVSLNLKGNIYKVNDIVGNNNSITQIGYKIWATDGTEPSDYTTLTPTVDSSGNITITDFEISNILFTKVYNYKIIIKDYYNKTISIDDGIVPTGQPIWSEYKDHVDFLKLTVGGYNPFEYSTTETICGVWEDGKPIYGKYVPLLVSTLNTNWVNGIDITGLNIDTLVDCVTFGIGNKSKLCKQGGVYFQIEGNYIQLVTWSTFTGFQYAWIQYTKTTD